MTGKYVKGEVMVAFKPEAELSAIEKVLGQYTFKKIFDDEFSGSKDREDKVLDRLYSLAVTPGTEATVTEELKKKYGPLIEQIYQPPTRRTI